MSAGAHVDGRAERGEATAAALLDAARTAFSEHGFAGASVRTIAAAAGVNPALVRYHFGSKAELFAAVIDEAMTALRSRLLVALAEPADLRGRAKNVLDAYIDHLEAQPEFPRLVQRGVLDGDPRVLELARDHLKPLVDLLDPDWLRTTPLASLGTPYDVVLTLFGAAVAPFLYAPLLNEAFGEDPLSKDALRSRRAHLAAVIDVALGLKDSP